MIEGRKYPAPTTFIDFLQGRFRLIATITGFVKASVVSDAEAGFEFHAQYAWDGGFFAVIPVNSLSSRVFADFIAVDEVDLSYCGSFAAKRVRHMSNVF